MEEKYVISEIDDYIKHFNDKCESIKRIIDAIDDNEIKARLKKVIKDVSDNLAEIKIVEGYILNYTQQLSSNIRKNVLIELMKNINLLNSLMKNVYTILKSSFFKNINTSGIKDNDKDIIQYEYNPIIKSIGYKDYEGLDNSLNNLSNYVKYEYSKFIESLYPKLLHKAFNTKLELEDLFEYMYVLSCDDANYNSNSTEEKEENKWKTMYEEYCNLVMLYCINEYPHLKGAFLQNKRPLIEFTELDGDVNSQFSGIENKILINCKRLCIHNPIVTAVAIRHELEHWYQTIVSIDYSENLKSNKKVYSNNIGYIYKSKNQYHKMGEDSIKYIYEVLGGVCIDTRYAEGIRSAAYSMMKVEYDAFKAQSEFEERICDLIQRTELKESIGELEEIPKEGSIKNNKEKYKEYKSTLNEFISLVTNNLSGFVEIIDKIDNETLASIFYVMPLYKKRKLDRALKKRIISESDQQNAKCLNNIRDSLYISMQYDKNVAEEQERI